MEIKSIEGGFAEVAAGRVSRRVNIEMLPHKIRTGDYVMVHAGFAIQKIDPREAKETLRLVDEISRGV